MKVMSKRVGGRTRGGVGAVRLGLVLLLLLVIHDDSLCEKGVCRVSIGVFFRLQGQGKCEKTWGRVRMDFVMTIGN